MGKFVDIYRDAEVWLETPEIVPATQVFDVDVNLSNHPFMDSAVDRMATLRNRINPYVPNPFIMGEEGFQNYIKFYESWAGEVRDSITVE